MRKNARIILFLIVFIGCGKNEEKTKPTTTEITESVYSSVIIQPDSMYYAYAIVNGILDKNLVDEGDEVKKGTPILQIINSNPQLNVENAQLSYELAKKNLSGNSNILKSMEEDINSARLKFENDSINFFRQKYLWEQKIGSKVEYDTKKLAYETSLNSVNQFVQNYDRTKNELQTQVKQAENYLKNSINTTNDFTVTSMINGKVYELNKNPGEIVNTMEPLAAIGSATIFDVEMRVDEVDIVKIKIGQEVLISLDAYNGQIFTAAVSKIYPNKDIRNQTFKVEAQFSNRPESLFPGLSGEANIVIATKKEALTIPRTYLIDNSKVKTEDGLITIQIGLQSLDIVEILSGITRDTWIYKPE